MKAGLWVVVRPGPYINAEVSLKSTPDLEEQSALRLGLIVCPIVVDHRRRNSRLGLSFRSQDQDQ